MREVYKPEINITFAQNREDGRNEEERNKKAPVKKCPNFAKAMQGYIKPKRKR